MKIASRLAKLCVALIVMGSLLSGCSPGGPAGEEPLTLEHAHQLEKLDVQKAVDEYAAIRSAYNTKEPETAAEALLESAKFTSDPNRYGTPAQLKIVDPTHLTKEGTEAIAAKRAQGDQLARESLKQLQQNYPHSKAAAEVEQTKLNQTIDDTINRRNSTLLQYKIVDALVAATGRRPGFSYWFALVVIAVFLKVITFPLLLKTYKSQREMQKMQPIIKEIQAKYKDDPQEAFRQQQAAFKEHGVNQFASCIPALIQMPIFIGMYNIIRTYETNFSRGHFLWVNDAMAHRFPGIIAPNLAQLDIPLLLMYAGTMFLTMKLTPQTDPQMAQQQQSMSVMMTLMMIWWFMNSKWPSAFLLYYLIQNILSAIQQYYFIYKPAKMAKAGGFSSGGAAAAPITPALMPAGPAKSAANGATGSSSKTNGATKSNGTPKATGATAPLSATTMRPRPKNKNKKR